MTGTLRIEGGKTGKQTDMPTTDKQADRRRIYTSLTREVTSDRRRGDVIVSDYLRRIKKLRVLKTPFGTLIDPANLAELRALLDSITADVMTFNASSKTCKLANCLLWEPLLGNRKASVEGWIARRAADGDPEIARALPRLSVALPEKVVAAAV
jgi:hypothetical protein